MSDLLVPLLQLPPLANEFERMTAEGIAIRRALPHEMSRVQEFIRTHFSQAWADEVVPGFCQRPITIWIAIREGAVVGFAAFECTNKCFFGPTGVAESERGRGIGRALLIACMHGLKELGYAYGVIGAAGPVEFYAKTVGAIEIPGSAPGVYHDPLKRE